jgi:hypothetical protein
LAGLTVVDRFAFSMDKKDAFHLIEEEHHCLLLQSPVKITLKEFPWADLVGQAQHVHVPP